VRIVSGVGEGSGLYTGQSAYIGLPDGAKDGAQIDTCALVDAEKWVKAEIFDGRSIISGNNGAMQTFYFKPPFGQIYTLGDGGVLVKAENKKIEFSVNSVGNSAGSEGVGRVLLFLTSITKPTTPVTTTMAPNSCAPGLSSASPKTNINAPRHTLNTKERICSFWYMM
jgi:hypothetical protein